MDVRIGVTDNPREINLELPKDADRAAIRADIDAALSGASNTLWLVDAKGREVGITAARVAYVELGPDGSTNPIGFG